MYLDLPGNPNCGEEAMATFRATGAGRGLTRLRLLLPDGWAWCAVTGWGPDGPVPARITPIEESGDGPALLATGGPWGLRLARADGPEAPDPAWALADGSQWAEPFLICRSEAEAR